MYIFNKFLSKKLPPIGEVYNFNEKEVDIGSYKIKDKGEWEIKLHGESELKPITDVVGGYHLMNV